MGELDCNKLSSKDLQYFRDCKNCFICGSLHLLKNCTGYVPSLLSLYSPILNVGLRHQNCQYLRYVRFHCPPTDFDRNRNRIPIRSETGFRSDPKPDSDRIRNRIPIGSETGFRTDPKPDSDRIRNRIPIGSETGFQSDPKPDSDRIRNRIAIGTETGFRSEPNPISIGTKPDFDRIQIGFRSDPNRISIEPKSDFDRAQIGF